MLISLIEMQGVLAAVESIVVSIGTFSVLELKRPGDRYVDW